MKTVIKAAAAVLMASLVLLLAACSVKPAPESSSDQTTSSAGSAEQTASETSADQTAAELKAEVSVASQNETEAPAEAQKEISGERSDPGDIYDATGFVSVTDVVPDVILEIRYYSTYNFIGDRVRGYEEPVALLSKEAAYALKNAADTLREKGYRLKIFDAYRPQTAVDHFVEWAEDLDDVRMKQYFYPELDKSVLFDYGYIARYSGHSRGCTVDLTLFDMDTGEEVDMGGSFDYFGELSHPDYPGVTEQQYKNRMLLQDAMTGCGFRACQTEWWDFKLIDEPYPDTYFSFPVSLDSLKY
ncbi:M15 family metallopeptidase [Ruminococcus sp.]|uniref:M15 family metallopeptidase n=1 Tax=Ruminococcus sp. TaxID=41978 RepID=UPI002E76285E|nr:M15 family metallopeptidase [Ruminococcus sp.]MEE1261912.1 M15 family metallopeptidase [Ruminococcus sp.]